MAFQLMALPACKLLKETPNKENAQVIEENSTSIVEDEYILMSTLASIENSSKGYLSFPINNISPTLKINSNGRFGGFAACNSFGGEFKKEGKQIKFEKLMTTRKYCAEASDIESIVISTLSKVNNYTIANGQLLLKNNDDLLMIYSLDNNVSSEKFDPFSTAQ